MQTKSTRAVWRRPTWRPRPQDRRLAPPDIHVSIVPVGDGRTYIRITADEALMQPYVRLAHHWGVSEGEAASRALLAACAH